MLHHLLVFPAVGLGTQGPDGGTLAPVEQPVLDTGLVRGLAHLAAQRVQLPDEMALSGAADGGVAGHIAHRVQIDGEAQGPHSHPGGGQCGLDAGVAGTHHSDIKFSRVISFHKRLLPSCENNISVYFSMVSGDAQGGYHSLPPIGGKVAERSEVG